MVRLRIVSAAALVLALAAFSAAAAAPAPTASDVRDEARRVRLPRPSTPVPAGVVAPDVERYLNIRTAVDPGFSASGKRLAFRTTTTGQYQVWMLERAGAWPEQLTFGAEPVGSFEWSPTDDDVFVFTRDLGGNERQQIFLANVATGEVRRLTTGDDVIHNWGGWSRDGRSIAYTSNERNQAFFDVYVMDVATGQARRVLERDGTFYGQGFSPDGRSYVALEARGNFDRDLWRIDLAGGGEPVRLTPHSGDVRYADAAWTPDGTALWLRCDDGREFLNLARIDAATNTLRFVETRNWDSDDLAVTRDGRLLAQAVNEDGLGKLVLRDLRLRSATQAVPAPALPAGVLGGLAWSPDGQRLAFALSGPQHPSDIWVYDRATGKATAWTRVSTAGLPRGSFQPSEKVTYVSFDSLRISGFLYRPPGSAGRPVPIVVNVHGGPEEQSQATFSGVTQYLLQRGFGVFYPNVRGSTGYGKAFTHLDDVDRRLDSVRDLAEGARWLVASGIAEPGKVAVFGGSYGGYMTLAALAFHPDLWACGVDMVGISNLRTFLANTGAWRRGLRAREYGDPDKDGAIIDAASPIHRVADIRAPLMVIQGANDPRVPQSEADQMVEAIRKNGGQVEYLLFPDEGHGLQKLPNRVKGFTQMADFLEKHLRPAPPPAP